MLNRITRMGWMFVAGLLGVVVVLVAPLLAQAPRDGKVTKAAAGTTAGTTPTTPAATSTPSKVGVVDVDAVINGYNKFKVHNEDIRAQALVKQNELMKLVNDIKQKGEIISKLTPNSPDYKKHADEITEWQAKAQAKQEQYKNEFIMKDAEGLATVYREVQDMVHRAAVHKGITMVLNSTTNKAMSGADPQSVMMAIGRPVVYADPTSDLTNEVIRFLNTAYKQAGGPDPKGDVPAAPGGGAPAQPTTAPGSQAGPRN